MRDNNINKNYYKCNRNKSSWWNNINKIIKLWNATLEFRYKRLAIKPNNKKYNLTKNMPYYINNTRWTERL